MKRKEKKINNEKTRKNPIIIRIKFRYNKVQFRTKSGLKIKHNDPNDGNNK